MARRDRRSWGRRELERVTCNKTHKFFALYHHAGYSQSAIASTLGMGPEAVAKMIEAADATVSEGEGGAAKL